MLTAQMRKWIEQNNGRVEYDFDQRVHYDRIRPKSGKPGEVRYGGKKGLCFGYSTMFLYHMKLSEVGADTRTYVQYVSDQNSGGGMDLVLQLGARSGFGDGALLVDEIPRMLADVGYKHVETKKGGLVGTLLKCIAYPGRYIVGWDGWCESGLGHVIAVDGLRRSPRVFDPNYGCMVFKDADSAIRFILKLIAAQYANQSNMTCDKFLPLS